jgi:hypothetical protein
MEQLVESPPRRSERSARPTALREDALERYHALVAAQEALERLADELERPTSGRDFSTFWRAAHGVTELRVGSARYGGIAHAASQNVASQVRRGFGYSFVAISRSARASAARSAR